MCESLKESVEIQELQVWSTIMEDVDDGWSTIIKEDFEHGGFQLFDQHGNNVNHYDNTMERSGVVCISNGEGGHSLMELSQIPLGSSTFAKFKAVFSFYATSY